MDSIEVVREDTNLRVILNRPDVHNAFEPKMIERLTQIFEDASSDKDLRCIILSGKGKSFCAGADLEWMKSMAKFTFEQNTRDSENLFKMFASIRDCPVPIIARAHGNIMGGGLGLLAVCDIVAAEKESRFSFSEAKLGLVPSVISSFVMKKASHSLCRQFMLTAEVFDCSVADKMSLIHFSGDNEEVDDFIQSKIDFLCTNGPEALRAVKKILNFIETHRDKEIEKETVRVIAERRVSAEGQEGIRAFLEKRKPSWIRKK